MIVFSWVLKNQLILLFSLFLLLFMSPTALFSTIYGFHCTISANFYFYLQYFQQKVFNFNKINGSQIDSKYYKYNKISILPLSNLFQLSYPFPNSGFNNCHRNGLSSDRIASTNHLNNNIGDWTPSIDCRSSNSSHWTANIDGLAHQTNELAIRWGERKSLYIFLKCFTKFL